MPFREDVLNQKKKNPDANEAFEVSDVPQFDNECSTMRDSLRVPQYDSILAELKTLFQYYAVTFDYTEKLRNVLIGLRKRLV